MTQFSPKVPAAGARPFCTGVREPKTSQAPALNISSCFQCLQGQETASSIDRTAPLLARVFFGAFLNRTGSLAPQLGSVSQPIMPLQPQGRSVRPRGLEPYEPHPAPPPPPPRNQLEAQALQSSPEGLQRPVIPETFSQVEENVKGTIQSRDSDYTCRCKCPHTCDTKGALWRAPFALSMPPNLKSSVLVKTLNSPRTSFE